MFDLHATVTGDSALQAKFESLSTKGSNKALVTASRAGTKAIAGAIKTAIPEAKTRGHDMKHVRSRVGTKVKSNRKAGLTTSKVGFDVGKRRVPSTPPAGRTRKKGNNRRPVNNAPPSHLLAAGTGIRRTRFTQANRGRVAAGNYIQRAVASSGAAVGVLMESTLREVIYDEATR